MLTAINLLDNRERGTHEIILLLDFSSCTADWVVRYVPVARSYPCRTKVRQGKIFHQRAIQPTSKAVDLSQSH
jgi:hypothetical protein